MPKVSAYLPDLDQISILINAVSVTRAKASFFKYEFVEDDSWSERVRQVTANLTNITIIPAIANYSRHGSIWTEKLGTYEWTHDKSEIGRAITRNRKRYHEQFVLATAQGPKALERWLQSMTRQGTMYASLLHDKIRAKNEANKDILASVDSLRRRCRIVQTGSAAAFTVLLPWAGLAAVPCTLTGLGFSLSVELAKFVKTPGEADCMIIPSTVQNTARDGAANVAQDMLQNKATAAVGARFVNKASTEAIKHQEQKVANILGGYVKSGGGKELLTALEQRFARSTATSTLQKALARRALPDVMARAGVSETAKLSTKQAKNISNQLIKLGSMKAGEKILYGVVNSGASLLGLYFMSDDLKKMAGDVKKEIAYLRGG